VNGIGGCNEDEILYNCKTVLHIPFQVNSNLASSPYQTAIFPIAFMRIMLYNTAVNNCAIMAKGKDIP